MGSHLTVVNDTPYEWHCRMVTDLHSIKIFALLFGAADIAFIRFISRGGVIYLAASAAVYGGTNLYGYLREKIAKLNYHSIPTSQSYTWSSKNPIAREVTCVTAYQARDDTIRIETFKKGSIDFDYGYRRKYLISSWLKDVRVEAFDLKPTDSLPDIEKILKETKEKPELAMHYMHRARPKKRLLLQNYHSTIN